VAGEVNFNTLRKEALASTLTAAGKDSAAAFGLHPGTEAKLLFARALAGLISAFHKTRKLELETLSKQREMSSCRFGRLLREKMIRQPPQ
jgi:hypothetical protein